MSRGQQTAALLQNLANNATLLAALAQTQQSGQNKGQGKGQEPSKGPSETPGKSPSETPGKGPSETPSKGPSESPTSQHTSQGPSQGQGSKPQPQPTPKPPLTERTHPTNVRIVLVFHDFQEFGGVRTVWGTLVQKSNGAADGIPAGLPFGGSVNYLCRHIEGPVRVQPFVQLEDAASTTLTNATEFTPDKGTNVATVTCAAYLDLRSQGKQRVESRSETARRFQDVVRGRAAIEGCPPQNAGGDWCGSRSRCGGWSVHGEEVLLLGP